MTGRYVTDAEKAGAKRRVKDYFARKAALGLKRRTVLATDAQAIVLQGVAMQWNGGKSHLTDEQRKLAAALKPEEPTKPEGTDDADQG